MLRLWSRNRLTLQQTWFPALYAACEAWLMGEGWRNLTKIKHNMWPTCFKYPNKMVPNQSQDLKILVSQTCRRQSSLDNFPVKLWNNTITQQPGEGIQKIIQHHSHHVLSSKRESEPSSISTDSPEIFEQVCIAFQKSELTNWSLMCQYKPQWISNSLAVRWKLSNGTIVCEIWLCAVW